MRGWHPAVRYQISDYGNHLVGSDAVRMFARGAGEEARGEVGEWMDTGRLLH